MYSDKLTTKAQQSIQLRTLRVYIGVFICAFVASWNTRNAVVSVSCPGNAWGAVFFFLCWLVHFPSHVLLVSPAHVQKRLGKVTGRSPVVRDDARVAELQSLQVPFHLKTTFTWSSTLLTASTTSVVTSCWSGSVCSMLEGYTPFCPISSS